MGSTSIPGLAAKPIINLLLVGRTADKWADVPALEQARYVRRIREPNWYQHRPFKGPDTNINRHVFSAGVPRSTTCSRSVAGCPGDLPHCGGSSGGSIACAERSAATTCSGKRRSGLGPGAEWLVGAVLSASGEFAYSRRRGRTERPKEEQVC
jgi:hypothetical protein